MSGIEKHPQEKPPWRKILYEKQDFPDNFSGPEFLKDLRKNVTAKTYGYSQSVRSSCVVMQELSSVLVYVVLFVYVFNEFIGWHVLLGAGALFFFCGYSCMILLDKKCHTTTINLKRDVKTLAMFVGFGYGMGPVFKTLTDTISTDTIYATATLMFLLSLVFRDYGVDVSIVSSTLSLNAAVFGAVCLISRLPTSNEAFCMLTLAVELFALWPMFRRKLTEAFRKSDVWLTAGLACSVIVGLGTLSLVSTLIYVCFHLFVTFVCPYWLIKMQPMKSTIHGPWDEAVIKGDNG